MIGKYIGDDTVRSGIFLFMASESFSRLCYHQKFPSLQFRVGSRNAHSHNINSIILNRRERFMENSFFVSKTFSKKLHIWQKEKRRERKDKNHNSFQAINLSSIFL